MNKKPSVKKNTAALVLSATLLAVLTQGINSAHAQSVGVTVTTPAIVVERPAPVVVVAAPAPVVVVQDDYVYYPNYAIYYNSSRHQYAYMENNVWVWQPAPRGVTVDVLFASPSVHMDFHDSINNHHAEMLRRYPHDWKASDEHHDDKDHHAPGDHPKDAPDREHDKK